MHKIMITRQEFSKVIDACNAYNARKEILAPVAEIG